MLCNVRLRNVLAVIGKSRGSVLPKSVVRSILMATGIGNSPVRFMEGSTMTPSFKRGVKVGRDFTRVSAGPVERRLAPEQEDLSFLS
jgi:hypothetical protein